MTDILTGCRERTNFVEIFFLFKITLSECVKTRQAENFA